MEHFETTVGGTRVLLLGTGHHDRENSDEVYRHVAAVRPDILYVELEPTMGFKTHAKNHGDLGGLYAYTQDHAVEVRQYDTPPEKSMLEHHLNGSEAYEAAVDAAESANESRRALSRHHPEMFSDIYVQREEHAAVELLDSLYDPAIGSLVIHTGGRHFGAIKHFLQFVE